ncbi:MAG TPA: transposase, partial [Candidatus Limnocylindrales bacterium]|nr:transposase [Candidatus Limnocylindrales bacterium]
NRWGVEPHERESTYRTPAAIPLEFRTEAVRLDGSPGNSIRQVARDLGVSNESLRRWAIRIEIDCPDSPRLSTDDRAELTRLRHENRTLRIGLES